MKSLVSLAVIAFLLMVGCSDNNSTITSPETGYTQLSNGPNWVKLPADIYDGLGVETVYSKSKLIEGEDGGNIKLRIRIKRPGNPLGDYVVRVKVRVRAHSFPDEEERMFTISLDPENAVLNISPSPNTLSKHLLVDFFIKGIDVSDLDPDTFNFVFVSDDNQILSTESDILQFNTQQNWIKVKKAEIFPMTVEMTPPGSRFGWVR